MLRLSLAAFHLFALAIGPAGVFARARWLGRRPLTRAAVERAFVADNWWGIAAVLWLATGLWRLFAGTEKATTYYRANGVFAAKMAMFVLVGLLEIWPMITLIRWRRAARSVGDTWQPNEKIATRISQISYVETVLLLAIVVAAVSMARGYGYRGGG